MAKNATDDLKELKKIAKIKYDRERLQLLSAKERLTQVEAAQRALNGQIRDLHDAEETDMAAMINAQSYLTALSGKARQLGDQRRKASERTRAQREKIKAALASKIRIDSMG